MTTITPISSRCRYREKPNGKIWGYLVYGVKYEASLIGKWYYIKSLDAYSHESVVTVIDEHWLAPAKPVYISQWAKEASARRNDCGPTCVMMHARGRGVTDVRIDDVRPAGLTGLTTSAQLIAELTKLRIPAKIHLYPYSAPLTDVKPYSILLISYAPIRSYAQDVRFTGLHWLIYVGESTDKPGYSVVLDPDYSGIMMNEGDHKLYPTKALDLAWKYATTKTAIEITDL